MNVDKSITLHIELDSSEQFTTTANYGDKKIHVTSLTARYDGEGGEPLLARIDASGFAVLGQTGKPGKRAMSTKWFSHRRPNGEQILVAPGAILSVVGRAWVLAEEL